MRAPLGRHAQFGIGVMGFGKCEFSHLFVLGIKASMVGTANHSPQYDEHTIQVQVHESSDVRGSGHPRGY